MKTIIMVLCITLMSGCDGQSTKPYSEPKALKTFNTFTGYVYDVVCIDSVQYLQNLSGGNLTVKVDLSGRPLFCEVE